jgi:hypothetical protein
MAKGGGMSAWIEAHRKPIRIIRRTVSKAIRRYTVNSSTDSRRHYTVTFRNGKWACSCHGWIFPRKIVMKNGKPVLRSDGKVLKVRENCRHIKQMMVGRNGGAR